MTTHQSNGKISITTIRAKRLYFAYIGCSWIIWHTGFSQLKIRVCKATVTAIFGTDTIVVHAVVTPLSFEFFRMIQYFNVWMRKSAHKALVSIQQVFTFCGRVVPFSGRASLRSTSYLTFSMSMETVRFIIASHTLQSLIVQHIDQVTGIF